MAIEYKSKKVDLTTTNNTVIYTCPAATKTIIKSILISDDSGSGDTATLTLTDSGSNVFRLKKEAVAGDATDEILINPLVMEASEILKAQAVTAGRLHVIVSLMEVTSDTNNPL
jgi:hypothetical protein